MSAGTRVIVHTHAGDRPARIVQAVDLGLDELMYVVTFGIKGGRALVRGNDVSLADVTA